MGRLTVLIDKARAESVRRNRKWFLQTGNDGFSFVDEYVHPQCRLIKEVKDFQFRKKKSLLEDLFERVSRDGRKQ